MADRITIPADLLAEVRADLEAGAPASLRWKPRIADGADDVLILDADNPHAIGIVAASVDADEPWPWAHLMASVDGIGPVWAEAWLPAGDAVSGPRPSEGDRVLVLADTDGDCPEPWIGNVSWTVLDSGPIRVLDPDYESDHPEAARVTRWALLPPAQPTPGEASTPDKPHQDAVTSPARARPDEHRVVGTRLRDARRAMRLTQAEVAEAIDIGRSSLVAVEQGTRKVTGLELRRLARLYHCDVAWLLGEEAATDPALQAATANLSSADKESVLRFAQFLAAQHRPTGKDPEAPDA